jgi:hypothetical protein
MLVDLTPTWPIVIPQPAEARLWCRRPLVVEVLVIAGVVVLLAVLGALLWPLSGSLAEPWRIVALELLTAAVLIAVTGRFLVPRRSAIILTAEGILRRDHFTVFGLLAWSEDNWLAAWEDVLSYQMQNEPTAAAGRPPRWRLTFNVLGRYGSRPVRVLCDGSPEELGRLQEVLQGQVARQDAGLLEVYRLKRPARARRWDALLVAACLAIALFPDLALQACLVASGSSAVVQAPPLDALPLWRYVLGGVIIVLGIALTTRVQHAISLALALAVFFFTIPAALIPVDGHTMSAFFGGSMASLAATLGIALVLLLKLGVIAAITLTWLEYVTRGMHEGSRRRSPPSRRVPPLQRDSSGSSR